MINNPVIQMMLTGIFWSLGGVLIKLVDWNPYAIAGTRSLVAMIFLCIVNKSLPRFIEKKSDGSVSKSGTVNTILGGILYAATMLLFVVATKLTTAANAIFLQYTSPLYLIIFGPFFIKEKNTWVDYTAVAGLLIGMFILIGGDLSGGNLTGDIFALMSGVTFGFSTMFLRRQKNASPLDSLILANFFCFVFALPFIFTSGMPSFRSCIGLLILGVVQIGLSSYFWGKSLKKLSALSSVIIGMLEPILNPIWVAMAVKEIPEWQTFLGGGIILIIIVFHVAMKNKKSRN